MALANLDDQAIFEVARKISSPETRQAYLAQVCGEDLALAQRIKALLQAHDDSASFLVCPHPGISPPPTINQLPPERLGAQIGPYKLLQQIGEGGMGVVYLAEQIQPVQRKVALKVIRPGMDSRQVIARFKAERQALAMMDHVNIARVLDAGATDSGRPYFVMELVHGVPITKYCDDNRLTPRQRLELFVPVCQAIQHAHQKGIIHRDIKPSNVMVTLYDGKPVPKVIDFGVAKATEQKLTERTLFTQYGTMVGTLEYMSPEQAEMSALGVDTRSDIFSLGVLLYELLTGSTPLTHKRLKEAAYAEVLRMIREEEAPKPSTRLTDSGEALASISAQRHMEPAKLSKLMRGELDWIVMKTLEKDRGRRYETASAFAADVQRYLDDETVLACPPSAGYRLRKFARRNKAALVMASVIGVALLLAVGSLGWVVRDRDAGRVRTAGEVNQFLQQAESLYADNKLPEAVAEVQKARGVLESGSGDADLGKRVRQWLTDLATVLKLEEIRLESVADRDREFAGYSRVFRDYCIDVEALSVEEAAARVAASQIKLDLALVLRTWGAGLRFDPSSQDRAGGQRLLAISQAADPDPWWLRYVGAAEAKDMQAFRELVAEADAGRLNTRTLSHLGDSLRTSGDAEAAVAFLRKAQRQHPGDFSINSSLAVSLSELKSPPWDEIMAFMRAALAVRPQTAHAHSNLGAALYHQKKFDEAIPFLKKAIEIDPKYGVAYHNLGTALHDQKKWPEALAAYRMAIEIDPKYADAYYGLGNVLREQKKLDEAIAAYHKAIELDPKRAKAYNNLGATLHEQKKLDEAVAAFHKAIELDPKFAAPYSNLGATLRKQKKLDEAVAALRKAIDLDPKFADAYSNLGAALHDQQEWPEALAAYRMAIEIDPKDATAYYGLGNVLSEQKKLDEAIAAYQKALEIDLKYADAYANLGVALYVQKKLAEAISAFKKAIELDPKDAKAYFNLGNALRDQKKPNEAVAAYRKAIEVDPQPYSYNNLGALLCDDLKDYEKAIECFRKAIELDPKDANTHNNLGNALSVQKKLDEAIDAYRKAIELDPKQARAYKGLGNALRDQAKLDEAIDAYRMAIELDPKSAVAHYSLGLALHEQKELDEAIACYRKAIELDPKYASAYSSLGLALREQKKLPEAIDAYRMAIELDPKSAVTYSNLGALLCDELKDYDKAIECFRKAIELDSKVASAYGNLNVALRRKGWNLANSPDPNLRDLKRALEACKEAVEVAVQSGDGWQYLGWVQYRAGNWKASIEALEKSCQLQKGGTGDAGQWIVVALAHAKLADQEGLPKKEREHHRAEARRWFDQADKQIESRWPARPDGVLGQATWDFRAEARELMAAKDSIK